MITKYPASYFIKMAMDVNDMSIEALSRQTNIPTSQISLILDNKIPFTNDNDMKIAPLLGFPIGHLLKLETIYQASKDCQQ